MNILSRLSDECKKCSNVKSCNNKRMVACALADMPKMPLSILPQNTMKPNTMPVIQVPLRDTSVQAQIAEKLKKDFYKEIFDINCVFNKP